MYLTDDPLTCLCQVVHTLHFTQNAQGQTDQHLRAMLWLLTRELFQPFLIYTEFCFFKSSGDHSRPIVYQVENLRDGQSFSNRLVKAKQNGEIIFTSMVSYHRHEVPAVTHQYFMPEVPLPESLPTYEDLLLECLRFEYWNILKVYWTFRGNLALFMVADNYF